MGFKDLFKSSNDEELYDENYNDGYGDTYDGDPDFSRDAQQPSVGIGSASSALELKVVKPERFDSVPENADHLLNRRTVVLNLESTNKETARRLIDFLSGVAYSINGQLKRVAANTYVITPDNVDVSGEQVKDDGSAAAAASLDDTFEN